LLNKKDSAEIILKSALDLYRENGYNQQALRYSKTLIFLYIQDPQRLAEAKVLMDQFETESDLFDEHHELPPSQRQYYYYKGSYYEGIHQLDSAEYYYRKIYRPGMSYASQDPMYRGLLSVFTKRRQADSIAKYAQLYCMVNDSSIAIKDRDIIAQMAESYNYNSLQNEAHKSEIKAYKRLMELIVAVVIIGLFIIAAVLSWRYYQERIKKLKTEFIKATEEYEDNLHQLQLLEFTYQKVIAEHTDSYSRVYQDYESEKSRLLEENGVLQNRIDELQNNEAISKHIEVSESFKKEMIVTQILNLAEKRSGPLKEHFWTELIKAFGKRFPALYNDLRQHCDAPQNIRVCILTVLDIGNDDQAIMLDTTKQRVSNIRRDLNNALFNEPSSRTLRKNLVVQYNIYGLERNSKPKKD